MGLLPYDLLRNPAHWTIRALLEAFERGAPLICFRAIESVCYEAIWPVWDEDFAEDAGRVLLAAADTERNDVSYVRASRVEKLSRARPYSQGTRKHRNHQAWFSSQTRSAYSYRCAFCRLALGRLLVAAHIKSESRTRRMDPPRYPTASVCRRFTTRRSLRVLSEWTPNCESTSRGR